MRKECAGKGLSVLLSLFFLLCFCTIAGADERVPISIDITFDKSPAIVNEPVQAVYSITGGSGTFTKIEYHWDTYADETWNIGPSVSTSETSGTISYTPESGSRLRLEITTTDSDRYTKTSSATLQIKTPADPDDTEPVSITVSYEKSPVFAGETVRASYTVSGGTGVYTDIQYRWDIYDPQEGWIPGTAVTTAEASASVSFTPDSGTKVRLFINVTDSEGHTKGYSSSITVLTREILVSDYPSSIRAGERFTLYAGINDGTQDTFSFESTDPAVITVDAGGSVLGIAQGTASVIITGNETGLCKTIEITVTTSEPAPLTASMGTPSVSTSGSGSSLQYTLTFQTNVEGGVSPYTFSYTLCRDDQEIYSLSGDGTAFTVTGSSLGVEGTYTAKAVVEDSRGTSTVTWSSGYFRKGSTSDTVGDILMDTPDYMLPADIKTLEAESFENTSASAVYIPDGCTSIEAAAFSGCSHLVQIRIPEGCAIAEDAFSGCPYLTIFGVKGSPAESFAISHDGQVKFIPLQ